MDLGEAPLDRDGLAVRAGCHVAASQDAGELVRRRLELEVQDVGKSAFLGFDDCVRVRRLRRGGHHDGVQRVVILGRSRAGKSALARQLSDVTGIPAVELDALFWQPGPTPVDPSRWAACQHELVQRSCWILDGDLGPYDTALEVRLRAADTIVVLDFTFLRCAWRTLRRGREQAEYWRWVRAYRRRSLPDVMRAISSEAPHAKLYVLRNPAMVQRFADEVRQTAAQERRSG
jgi:adenylate kinase family enzyme